MAENYLKSLEAQVAATRTAGKEPRQDLLDKIELEKQHIVANQVAKEKLQAEFKQAQAVREAGHSKKLADQSRAAAERLKVSARTSFIRNGGQPADFEKAWPGIHEKILQDRTAAEVTKQPKRSTVRL
jgi:hypothetical protein